MRSNAARPQGYAKSKPQVTTFAARTIRWGGILLLTFIVFHIAQITLGWVGWIPLWLVLLKVAVALVSGAAAVVHSVGTSRAAKAIGGAVGSLGAVAAMALGVLSTTGS